jgi:hypothetical protein
MHELLPDGDEIRRAVKWVSANLQEDSDRPVQTLIQDAVFKFDLSPLEANFLFRFYTKKNTAL